MAIDDPGSPNFLNRWLSKLALIALRRTRGSLVIPLSQVYTRQTQFHKDNFGNSMLALRFIYALSNNLALKVSAANVQALDATNLLWYVSSVVTYGSTHNTSSFDLSRGQIGNLAYNLLNRYTLNNRNEDLVESFPRPKYDGQLLYGNGLLIEAWVSRTMIAAHQFSAADVDVQIPTSILGSMDIRYANDFLLSPIRMLVCDYPARDINYPDEAGGHFALPLVSNPNMIGNVTQLQ